MNYQSDDRRHVVDCVQYFCPHSFDIDHLETLETQASETVGFTGLKRAFLYLFLKQNMMSQWGGC